jgi:hypothetical protein
MINKTLAKSNPLGCGPVSIGHEANRLYYRDHIHSAILIESLSGTIMVENGW